MNSIVDAVKIAEQTQKALHYFLDYQSKLPKDSDVCEQYNEIAQRLIANLEALQVLSKPLRAFSVSFAVTLPAAFGNSVSSLLHGGHSHLTILPFSYMKYVRTGRA